MHDLAPVHGGSRRRVAHDLSTNANQLGPCPAALWAASSADLSRYPDPQYETVRRVLASRHGCSPGRIVVGAGASELILRLVRRHAGPVRVLGPSFSEYRRCALLEGRTLSEVQEPAGLAGFEGLAFACWPNNPTGQCWDPDSLAAGSRQCRLVLDLAYADMVATDESLRMGRLFPRAWLLHSPNKAFGLTGLRAAYVICPEPDLLLEHLAPAWVLDVAGAAFLEASVGDPALAWLDRVRPKLHRLRRETAELFRARGCEVAESPANFLMTRVGEVSRYCASLAQRGVCVRDAGTFGMPGWIRVAGAPAEARLALAECLDTLGQARTLSA
jgi:histidinol-phosphate aminotransferase